MNIKVENQPLQYTETPPHVWLDWVEAYDSLERHWPYSRQSCHRIETPHLIQAASRMVSRRQHRPPPARHHYASTVAYYEAMLPLLKAQTYWDRISAWRYVRPMMIRVMLRHRLNSTYP